MSTLLRRFLRTEILLETFAPPIIATKGLLGSATASPKYLISFSIKKPATAGTVFALSGKASLPLTSIGGDGQAKLQMEATLTTSGDLAEGSIALNSCGLAGVYDPETDIYETTSFKAGDIETNLDPHTAAKESQPADDKGTGGETPTPSEPENKDSAETGDTEQTENGTEENPTEPSQEV